MAAPASYARRSLIGNAGATTVPLGLGASDGSCAIASATNWPSGSGGNFLVVIDRGQNTEELAWCSGVSGTTLTFSQRGAQGVSGVAHAAGCTIALSMGTQDLDEANQVVSAVLGQASAAKGDIFYMLSAAGPNTLSRLGIGTNTTSVLGVASGVPAWQNGIAVPYGIAVQTGATACALNTDTLLTNMSASTGVGTTANGMTFGTNVFTIPTGQGGLYRVTNQVLWNTSADNSSNLRCKVGYNRNSGTIVYVPPSQIPASTGADVWGASGTWDVVLAAGDTIGGEAFQGAASAGANTSGDASTRFSVVKVSS